MGTMTMVGIFQEHHHIMPCEAPSALLLTALRSPACAHCAIKPLPSQHHICIARIT